MSKYLTAYTTRKLSRSEANERCADFLFAGAVKSAGALAMLGISLASLKFNKNTVAAAFGTAGVVAAVLAGHDFKDAESIAKDYSLDVDM